MDILTPQLQLMLLLALASAIVVSATIWKSRQGRTTQSFTPRTSQESNHQESVDKSTVEYFRTEVTRLHPRSSKKILSRFSHRGAELAGLNLSRFELQNCDFSRANMTNINLQDSKLRDLQLVSTNLQAANLKHATLSNVNLTGANLQNCLLSGADLQAANLESANLTNARYDFLTLWPVSFDPDKNGAISIDGLGPQSLTLCVTDSRAEDMMRCTKRIHAIAAVRYRVGAIPNLESDINCKLDHILSPEHTSARHEWFYKWLANGVEKPNSELYSEMTIEDFYYFAAHTILYHKNTIAQATWDEATKEMVISRYFHLWRDFLELYEYRQRSSSVVDTNPKDEPRPNFESPIEMLFWEEWRRQGNSSALDLIYQHQVKDTFYRVDFAHLSTRTAIELDGYEYHSSREQFTKDRKRQRDLERLGWRFIRFSGSEITRSPADCYAEVVEFIHTASQREIERPVQSSVPTGKVQRERTRKEIIEKLQMMVTLGAFDVTTIGDKKIDELTLEEMYSSAAEDISFTEAMANAIPGMAGAGISSSAWDTWLELIEEAEKRHASQL